MKHEAPVANGASSGGAPAGQGNKTEAPQQIIAQETDHGPRESAHKVKGRLGAATCTQRRAQGQQHKAKRSTNKQQPKESVSAQEQQRKGQKRSHEDDTTSTATQTATRGHHGVHEW